MKYLSIDTETTGLDPETCQILSFAAVLEDTENVLPVEDLPHIHLIIKRDFIQGEPYALNMNKDLIKIIKEGTDERLIYEDNLDIHFWQFLKDNGLEDTKLKIAGKNFSSFDKKFIDKLVDDNEYIKKFKFHHRVLDVGSVFVDFKNDEWLPTLDDCKQKANIEGVVTHDALEDARDVIRVLRTKY